jgi:two-component system phosphate regulon response regulator PhoB
MPAILVVDDDPAIRDMIRLALTRGGYEVLEAGNALDARQIISTRIPDLILLDWMMPGQTGFAFASALQKDPRYRQIPVIMLTARDQEEDKVAALETGADDYVAKPFSVSELLARIKAVLRRTGRDTDGGILATGSLRLDSESHRATANDIPLELPPAEFQLLMFFMTHPERVYSRQQLIDGVWGTSSQVEERTIDVHIRRLRMALEPSGHDKLIQTVRGSGYRLSTQE